MKAFPPLELADENGLLAIGGDLDVATLLLAYRSGIFPWPIADEAVLTWFSPPQRAVLFLDEVRVSRSLRRALRRTEGVFRLDSDFESVIRRCAEPIHRGDQRGTWITEPMIEAYIDLHRAGHAHSVECWLGGELVGGLYGVAIGGMFAGESLFFRVPNASKMCLAVLVHYLRAKGVGWIDCQQMTPLLEGFGAREVPRMEFVALLQQAVDRPLKL
ncbi:MAG: leucyl/phenylalanyl-tRNA--protein transferase, partial [Bdellovibrionales bacterium]|nr:leucyl/phenylalanyl-tRNA--protein transferase [Bdellovibrionales bacterium]